MSRVDRVAQAVTGITRQQLLGLILVILTVTAFGSSWSHTVFVLTKSGMSLLEAQVIATLPEVTCLAGSLRLMTGDRSWPVWAVLGVSFTFVLAANASTAGGSVSPDVIPFWKYAGAVWPGVSLLQGLILWGHGKPHEPASVTHARGSVRLTGASLRQAQGSSGRGSVRQAQRLMSLTAGSSVSPAVTHEPASRVTKAVPDEPAMRHEPLLTPAQIRDVTLPDREPEPASRGSRVGRVAWVREQSSEPTVAAIMARFGVSRATATRDLADARKAVETPARGTDG